MSSKVNNEFYNDLGEEWYNSDDHAIALLRVEQDTKNPWVLDQIKTNFSRENIKILDIGCGGGFLTNFLAHHYDHIFGVDLSESSLSIARKYDSHKKVSYQKADAYHLPFDEQEFEVVCVMDFLEHVEDPKKVLTEAARVLKPGGILLFHTFNRNFISWLIVIKAVEWLVPKVPKNLHILRLFIKPRELKDILLSLQFTSLNWVGIRPRFNLSFFISILRRKIVKGFSFKIIKGTLLGYMGVARKNA